ncbi:ABC transporter substrate-binding protein [Paenalcaligenes niemegkensis]|uniref:ABC transporter substrate-binding protein n=1 Tax=Paenalcaligenes niemegkensis TaxID=2895469 RepID=UPI001EE972CA|nr:ABC transporter substrate-binding protein [Paenalcaligenes niemegkensis]MCQ9617177.1 ABC transporter substrate-binding protein [Paenalcaligenes niemegkensis]
MKKFVASSVAALMTSVALAASAQTLTIGFADPLSSLDPQLNNHAGDRSASLHFWNLLTENLHNELQPSLATSWKAIDDHTWEFTLRDDVKWQDGEPFTAEDLVFSYERAKNVPGSVATFAGYLRTIESVSAADAHTLVVKTNVPNPDLPLDLASVHVVSKHIGEKSTTEDYNSGVAVVGTGAYKLVSYTPGDRILMERSDTYWGEPEPWEKVNYRYINNAAARTAALLAGDVDVIDKVSVSDLDRLKKAPNVNVFPYDGLRVMLLQPSFNPAPNPFITDNNGKVLEENPLLDQRVRKALSIAINREAIVSRMLQGAATVANQWMPKDTFGFNEKIEDIPYDVNEAKALLAEAGFPEGFKLTLHVPNDRYPQGPEVAQAVAQFWTRAGVQTNIEVVPWAVYSSQARKNEYAVTMLAWGNGTGEARYALVNVFATTNPSEGLGSSNWGRYSNAQVDAALEQATTEFDSEKRRQILSDSATVVMDDAAVFPLFHYQNIWAAKKGLKVGPWTSDRTIAQMVKPE